MDSTEDRRNKLREERMAREKARIDKLRELNLKKYSNYSTTSAQANIQAKKANIPNRPDTKPIPNPSGVKNSGTFKRAVSAPAPNFNKSNPDGKTDIAKAPTLKICAREKEIKENIEIRKPLDIKNSEKSDAGKISTEKKIEKPNNFLRKSFAPSNFTRKSVAPANMTRKSLAPINMLRKTLAPNNKPIGPVKSQPKPSSTNLSVFERLYQPKVTRHAHCKDIEKLQTDPDFFKKVVNTTGLILNKRHTIFDNKPKICDKIPPRRSISAIHLKTVSKNELKNCIHSWSSIGEKLNKSHLKNINEDDTVKEELISAVKSERKKVTFMTPAFNYNTPSRDELQTRLNSWLQKRGKSLDSYQHLQCFGICHLPKGRFDRKLDDDDNKENVALESDSDNESYAETMNEPPVNVNNKWRSASIVSDSVDFNDSQCTMTTCSEGNDSEEVVIGALNNLTELLKEGYDWTQCARWLRAIRERFPSTMNTAAYWECRAALEETRGDLPASVQCWEEAIAKGTEQSVADASLDLLLDKFMQLKISPNSVKASQKINPKLVDVKNVFKSTIIRFAVQQAKLRQSGQLSDTSVAPTFNATPVRRSGRLRHSRTPLSLATSLAQAEKLASGPLHFQPNRCLQATP